MLARATALLRQSPGAALAALDELDEPQEPLLLRAALTLRGRALLRSGKSKEAYALLRTLPLAVRGVHSRAVLLDLARAAQLAGDSELARSSYRKLSLLLNRVPVRQEQRWTRLEVALSLGAQSKSAAAATLRLWHRWAEADPGLRGFGRGAELWLAHRAGVVMAPQPRDGELAEQLAAWLGKPSRSWQPGRVVLRQTDGWEMVERLASRQRPALAEEARRRRESTAGSGRRGVRAF